MLETAEKLIVEDKQPALQQFLLLVGGLRALIGGEHEPKQVLDPSCCDPSRSRVTRRRSNTVHGVGIQGRTAGSARRPAVCCAATVECPGPRFLRPTRSACSALSYRGLGGGRQRGRAQPQGRQRPCCCFRGLASRARSALDGVRRALRASIWSPCEASRSEPRATPLRCHCASHRSRSGASTCRRGDGRQWPLGEGTRPPTHGRARAWRTRPL